MMTINGNTKIAEILKQHPEALEAIISISPKFNKLRNPLLRKLMASRTSINTASKIGGCAVNDFFKKLKPFGFEADSTANVEEVIENQAAPSFMQAISKNNLLELDVRPVIEEGKDPFTIITKKIKELKKGETLKLINSFEPVPLIQILSKQGFQYYVETITEDLVNTYFYKTSDSRKIDAPGQITAEDWDSVLKRFENKLTTIDVRHLKMPLPMMEILVALDKLEPDHALFVYHKRIPVFLLPELAERKFDHRIKEISDGQVHLLIFKL